MITIYGIKTVTESDIFNHCGKPNSIKELVFNNYKEMIDIFDDYIIVSELNSTLQRAEFNIVFIPLELVEEYVKFTKAIEALDSICNSMVTEKKILEIANEKKKIKKEFEHTIKQYKGKDNVVNNTCLAILLDKPITEYGEFANITNYYICTPRKILSAMDKTIDYTCALCGNKIKSKISTDDIPEWFYGICNDRINYYCPECKNTSNKTLSHIGDTFYKIKYE